MFETRKTTLSSAAVCSSDDDQRDIHQAKREAEARQVQAKAERPESFFSSLKTARTARNIYRTRNEPRQMCSTTSSAFTSRSGVIQRSGITAPLSWSGAISLTSRPSNRQQLKGVSAKRLETDTLRPRKLEWPIGERVLSAVAREGGLRSKGPSETGVRHAWLAPSNGN